MSVIPGPLAISFQQQNSMVSSVGLGIHDGPPSPHGDAHHHLSSRMDSVPPLPPPPVDYRHPPPVGYGAPHAPPMPHGYPYPPHYYGGPAPPPYGMPPGAYPSYYGHHPGYGPPPPPHQGRGGGGSAYGYSYDPSSYGYPTQQPRTSKKSDSKSSQRKSGASSSSNSARGPRPCPPSPLPIITSAPPPEPQQPWRETSSSSESPPVVVSSSTITAADSGASQVVKPIETDFHFFVKEMSVVLRPAAEEEVHASLSEEKASTMSPMDIMFLVNSNLNSRIIKAWEDLSQSKRLEYMTKEENDRRRFMNEDSVASRHCATLTARNKSPRADMSKQSNSNYSNKESRDPADQRNGKPSPTQSLGSRNSSGSGGSQDDEAPEEESTSTRRRSGKRTIAKPRLKEEYESSSYYNGAHESAANYDEQIDDQEINHHVNNYGKLKVEESESSVAGKRISSPITTAEEEEGTPTKRNRREGVDSGDDHSYEAREAV